MTPFEEALIPKPAPECLNEDQKEIWNFFEGARALIIKKNSDYGSSAFTPPLLAPHVSTGDGILTRMSDKVKRLINLLSGAKAQINESVIETVFDLGAYCFFYCIVEKRKNKR